MAKKDNKVSNSSSSKKGHKNDETNNKTAVPERKAKGHKQKGAGTVIVSKGEVTVGGVVMKEWQRTPSQLVQEYCQRQKRPKPIFKNERAPPGQFCIRLILPDAKSKDKDLQFSSTDSFPDNVLARNCTCLLALHHLQPTLPLHQKLPEPYASMWLKLTGNTKATSKSESTHSFVCSICQKTFEKEMGLKVHMKKEHSGKKSPVSPTSDIPESSPVESPSPTPTSPTPSTSTPTPTPVEGKKRPVADHRNDDALKDVSLEMKGNFTSKYDRMMAEEKRRVHRVQSENRRDIQKQLHKPPPVFLSEKNQQFILSLLQSKQFSLTDYDKQHDLNLNLNTQQEQLRDEMIKLGFPAYCLNACLVKCSSLTECIDWCCLHLKDEQLPSQFRAAGKQLEVKRNQNASTNSVYQCLETYGFNEDEIKEYCKETMTIEECLLSLLPHLLPTFKEYPKDKMNEDVLSEIDALKAIYCDDMKVELKNGVFKLQMTIQGNTGNIDILICLSSRLGYPHQSPIVLCSCNQLNDIMQKRFIQILFNHYQSECSGVLFEILNDMDSYIDQVINENNKGLLPSLSLIKQKSVHSKTSRQSQSKSSSQSHSHSQSQSQSQSQSHSQTPSKHTSTSRILSHSHYYGNPSELVTTQRQALPITAYKDQILTMINKHQVSIISGGTGCGKSTQVPQFLLEQFRESKEPNLNVIVCEPRRLSCLGLYNRVIEEQGFTSGSTCPIGYQVRGDVKVNSNTVITYCTTGVLLRQLQNEEPRGITHIIVDEIHERSILSDFLLFLLKRVMHHNPSIHIILMSATMNEDLFTAYFNGAPSLAVEGKLFPVEEKYLDDVIFDTHYKPTSFIPSNDTELNASANMESMMTQWCDRYTDYGLIPAVINNIFQTQVPWDGGVILVFLSGASEIKYVQMLVEEAFEESSYDIEVIACHGSLSTQEQKRVFETNTKSRRIVLSTNIAETSVTIPNCKYVIDTGKEKRVLYNSQSNISEMKEVWVSKASSLQRKGRAGRVRSGIVYRLYTRTKYQQLEDYTPPEIVRSPLDGVCLQVLRMKLGNPLQVLQECITAPKASSVERAIETLKEIQAVKDDNKHIELTPLGNHLADLPVDCRLGKMLIIGCLFHCVEAIVTITAFLSQRTVFRAPLEKRDEMTSKKKGFAYRLSDHLTFIRVYDEWCEAKNKRAFCHENFINYESMLTISSLRSQFIDELKNIHFLPRSYNQNTSLFNKNSKEENIIKAALTAGMYANVIKVEKSRIKFHKTIEGGAFESLAEAKEYRLLIHREIEGEASRNGLTRVYIHPSSINFSEREYPYPVMIYTSIMNTSKLFVHDVTVIPPYALLLFGGNIVINHFEGTISVDDWLQFTTPARVGVLVQALRGYIDKLLQDKYNKPEMSIEKDDVVDGICSILISNGL